MTSLTSPVNDKEPGEQQSTGPTGPTGPTAHLKCDATIEVYKYNHNKRSSFRHTLVSLSEKHSDLQTFKKDLRSEYGLSSDARRCQIGDFNIDIGNSREDKTYITSSQTEWQNPISRLYSGIGQYSIIVQLQEIQY
ncbi:hypothetical protein ACROYT_G014104 [Oculina patagonica]